MSTVRYELSILGIPTVSLSHPYHTCRPFCLSLILTIPTLCLSLSSLLTASLILTIPTHCLSSLPRTRVCVLYLYFLKWFLSGAFFHPATAYIVSLFLSDPYCLSLILTIPTLSFSLILTIPVLLTSYTCVRSLSLLP